MRYWKLEISRLSHLCVNSVNGDIPNILDILNGSLGLLINVVGMSPISLAPVPDPPVLVDDVTLPTSFPYTCSRSFMSTVIRAFWPSSKKISNATSLNKIITIFRWALFVDLISPAKSAKLLTGKGIFVCVLLWYPRLTCYVYDQRDVYWNFNYITVTPEANKGRE